VLAARTSTIGGALWAPYAAWLVFALVLSSEANAKARAQASTQP
jgi:tryptophan-rich sensory protein